jgi:hypothetical protein
MLWIFVGEKGRTKREDEKGEQAVLSNFEEINIDSFVHLLLLPLFVFSRAKSSEFAAALRNLPFFLTPQHSSPSRS